MALLMLWFELGKRSDHLHHHASGRRGGIDRLGQTPKPRPWPRPDRSIIVSTSRSERESRSSFHTTSTSPFAELIQEPLQFRPIPAAARGLLAKDTLAFRCFQRGHLRRGVLLVGGDASIADQHCANVSPLISIKQHFFATRQSCK